MKTKYKYTDNVIVKMFSTHKVCMCMCVTKVGKNQIMKLSPNLMLSHIRSANISVHEERS